MATSSIFNAIVPEALTKYNYPNWSSCVENYLLGQDLWDIIETESKPTENEATFNSWRKRNAMALHAIQISCGVDMLSRIRKIKSAKDAWESLAKMHKTKKVNEPTRPLRDPETETNDDYAPLLNAVATDDWNATRVIFEGHRNENVTVSSDGTTVLHHAVIKGHVKIVEELVLLMSREGLKKQDNRGRTALHCAATCGFHKMVACMVEREVELVSIADEKGVIPVVSACQSGNKDMTRYLYSHTPPEDLTSQDGINGATLLCYCITSNIFDVALELLQRCPRLAFASDAKEDTLISLLSQMPYAFNSGRQLSIYEIRITSFINLCIYSRIRVPSTPPSNDTRIDMPGQYQPQTNRGSIVTQGISVPSNVPSTPPSNDTRIDIPTQNQQQTNRGSIVTQVLGQLRGSLSDHLGIKQIYDTKLIHTQASQLLDVICEKLIPNLSPTGHDMDLVRVALFSAVKHGIVEFVTKITKADPNLLSILDTDKRSIFHCAIVSRQEKILSLVYGVDSHKKAALTTLEDEFGNNILHLAGMLAPSTRLHHIPGAALQMQRELQWFKEVERIVPPMCKEMLNLNGQTPRQLFTKEHSQLVKEGQKWMKGAASSCAFVGALIVTFTFTAALTPPGVNNQNNGVPIFWDKRRFRGFTTFSGSSFIAGITSILIFLEILTSRYAEEDFFKSLPYKMSLGLLTLWISILFMTAAFGASLVLIAHGQMQTTFTPISLLSYAVPSITAALLQYSLGARIVVSTFRSKIFYGKTKRWYK